MMQNEICMRQRECLFSLFQISKCHSIAYSAVKCPSSSVAPLSWRFRIALVTLLMSNPLQTMKGK